ncbi:MAG: MATE family efflux transporter, partial [Acetatifactor sp.]|nr:MATE family efflux transporter [Acetatifactor sp.]
VVVVGIVISVAGFIFMPQIARLLGASESILDDGVLYGRIIISAITFFMLQNSYQSFLVTAQKADFGLFISIFSGVMNMILDYVLVYVFRLGVAGAAVATALSQMAGAMIPTVYFLRENKSLLRFVRTRMDWRAFSKACLNGSSEMMTNLSASLVGMLYNLQLLKLAAENGVAAYGVIMYVSFIFMAVFFGYSVGINPVVGYHFGAGNKEELKSLLRKSLILTLVVGIAMTVAAELLALPFAKLYVGYDLELCKMTEIGMRYYSFSFLICGFNIFASAFFTGLNNGLVSALISFLRTLVIQVAAIFILPVFFDIEGIWMAIVVAEGVTLAVSGAFLLGNRKRYGY